MMIETTSAIRGKVRKSNIELLRIIAMLLVMVVHASFKSLDVPTLQELCACPVKSFFRIFSESVSIICINIFVLISGWFGINVKAVRLSGLIFQVYFWGILMYVSFLVAGYTSPMSGKDWLGQFLIKDHWFIQSYIVLYIFAPVLNAFVENTTKKSFAYFLTAFFVIQTLQGFVTDTTWFSSGYSPLSFIGLYLLARYMRRYPNKLTQLNKKADIFIYLAAVLIITLLALQLIFFRSGKGVWRLYGYSSPLVIIAAIYFFLFFTKLDFRNKLVNWIAISSFSIYLLHCDVHFPYIESIKHWYDTESTVMFLLYTSALMAGIFIAAILIDKVRITLWNLCLKCWGKWQVS